MGREEEEGSGWGTRVYLWRIHVDVWQNQYNVVKLKKLKKSIKKKIQCEIIVLWKSTIITIIFKVDHYCFTHIYVVTLRFRAFYIVSERYFW